MFFVFDAFDAFVGRKGEWLFLVKRAIENKSFLGLNAGGNAASILQALLLLMLFSSVALSFSDLLSALAVFFVFGAAAFYAATRLRASERRAGYALFALVAVLAAFFVCFASLDSESRASNFFLVPVFVIVFLALFFAVKRFFFSIVEARVVESKGNWLVVRVERSLAGGAASGVYAVKRDKQRNRGIAVGSVVRLRFKTGFFGLGGGREAVLVE